MMDAADMAARNVALVKLLNEKHGGRAHDLGRAVKRAGHLLPRRLRKQAMILVDAERKAAIPKLARQINMRTVEGAYLSIEEHLRAIDVADQRRGRWLGLAGTIAAQVLVVGAAFVFWLWWRDYI